MIGLFAGTNDIYIFFETNNEIKKLKNSKLQGKFLNRNPKIIGKLEVSINDEINDFTKTKGKKSDENLCFEEYTLEIKERVYEKFIRNGFYETHEGFRHINFINVNKMRFNDKMIYEQVSFYYKIKNNFS